MIIEYFDEDNSLVYSLDGNYSLLEISKYYICSSCLREFGKQSDLSRHKSYCFLTFGEGMNKVDKNSTEEYFKVLDSLGRISRKVQGLDFSITNEEQIKYTNKITLVYVKNNKILGFITFCLRELSNQYFFSIEDFFIVEWIRRKGIGTILFEEMLKRLNINKDNLDEVKRRIIVNSPSTELDNFLKKRGYNLTYWR